MGEKHILNNEYILDIKNLNIYSSKEKHIIKNLSVSIEANTVVSIIGPLFSGKTILLKSINRLNDLYYNIKTKGQIYYKGKNIQDLRPIDIRKKIGMIFKDPHVFPYMNIYNNVLSGYSLNRISLSKTEKDQIVEESLRDVYLWDEVKDDIYKKPDFLRKGQQQRLCIARTIALKPDIILMDEPTNCMSAYCSNRIEDMIYKYKESHTIIVVTKNLSQAARISDHTLFLKNGELVEYGPTSQLFWNPVDKRTEEFITNQSD